MKKILSLLLAAALCGSLLTACGAKKTASDTSAAESGSAASTGSSDSSSVSAVLSDPSYAWTNEYGLKFDVSSLDYANFDASSIYDENGYLTGITGTDYVTLPDDYAAVPVKESDIAVTEDEIDTYVSNVMSQYATTEQITDRAVADGDKVNIDYVGTVDGVAFTGGDTQGNGTTVTAGSTDYVDDFLTQIIGHKPGETFDVTVTFPDDYNDSTDASGNPVVLAGKEVVFKVTINYIEGESITPECTDEWVKANLSDYGFSTVQDVRDDLANYYREQNLYTFVSNYVKDNSTYKDLSEIPEDLVNYAAVSLLANLNQYATYYGTDLAGVIGSTGYASAEAYLDANASSIIDNIHTMLLTQALAEKLGVKIGATDAQTMLSTNYSNYTSQYGVNYVTMYATMSTVYGNLTTTAVVSQ